MSLIVNIILVPAFLEMVQSNVAIRVDELFGECAQVNRWEIIEIRVLPEHLYMLIQMDPDTSVEELVNRFKDGSTKAICAEFSEVKQRLAGGSLWAPGYYAETVGGGAGKYND